MGEEPKSVLTPEGRADPGRTQEPVWLVDARTIGSRPTGIGMYAARQCRRLMRLNPDHRFVLVTDVKESEELKSLESQGARLRVYGRRVFNSIGVIGYFRFLKRVIAEVQPEVFWQPNNLQPFRPKGAARVIVSLHDVYGLGWCWRYAPWHLYYRFAFRRTLRNVTEVWFNSRQTESDVRAAAPDLVAKLKGEVVYPIAEVPPKEEVGDYPHARPYFLYVGNIEYRKGADILIEAYRRYCESVRRRGRGSAPCRLVFAGIEKNVKVPRLEGIEVLGYVDEATKYSLMKSCAALVVPSRAEGYGMQIAEASAFGIPVLASDLAVFREIEARGRVTFPVGDADALAAMMVSSSRIVI